jgi:hypothetical protein
MKTKIVASKLFLGANTKWVLMVVIILLVLFIGLNYNYIFENFQATYSKFISNETVGFNSALKLLQDVKKVVFKIKNFSSELPFDPAIEIHNTENDKLKIINQSIIKIACNYDNKEVLSISFFDSTNNVVTIKNSIEEFLKYGKISFTCPPKPTTPMRTTPTTPMQTTPMRTTPMQTTTMQTTTMQTTQMRPTTTRSMQPTTIPKLI